MLVTVNATEYTPTSRAVAKPPRIRMSKRSLICWRRFAPQLWSPNRSARDKESPLSTTVSRPASRASSNAPVTAPTTGSRRQSDHCSGEPERNSKASSDQQQGGRMRYLERGVALVPFAGQHDRVGELIGEQRREARERQQHQSRADPLEDRAPRQHVYAEPAQATDEPEREGGEVARAESLAHGPVPAADLVGDTRSKSERDEHPHDAGERQQQSKVAGPRGADRTSEHDAQRSSGDQRPSLHENRKGGAAAEMAARFRHCGPFRTER